MLGQKEQDTNKKIWMWMPSLYIMKGLPISIVMLLSTIVYKRFGLSSSDVLFLTSWLMLAWVLKPLWRPMVDTLYKTCMGYCIANNDDSSAVFVINIDNK